MSEAKIKADALVEMFRPHTRLFNKDSGFQDDIQSAIECAKLHQEKLIDKLGVAYLLMIRDREQFIMLKFIDHEKSILTELNKM